MDKLLPNVSWPEIGTALIDTLIMLGASLFFTLLLALPLGVLMYLTASGNLKANLGIHRIVSFLVNIVRSVPFIILMITVLPLTAFLTGTTLGVRGAVPPMVIAAVPFMARLVELALREVDKGLVESGQAMAATTWQCIRFILLPEARPALIAAGTVTAIALIDYTAMAGVIGGGGLGDLAVRYGYQRFQTDVMVVTVALLVLLVQVLQFSGDRLVLHYTRRR